MKKYYYYVFFILFSFYNNLYTQQLKNIATSIEVTSIISNKVTLKWKSDVENGVFAIYYNLSKPILNPFTLKESSLIINSNFIGENQGTYFEYEYSFELNKTGSYYFSVILNYDGELFDNIARNILIEDKAIQKIVIIPGINSTIQPIAIQILNQKRTSLIKTFPTYDSGYLITSLTLSSYEDIFQLKWNVYPKNLSQYIFIIYRSKYPIIQYGKPTGLPEYARVTNQFTFEDSNISYENPYYYAVVAENSIQWDSGINVFTTPAVLLRKSPPLEIKAKVEFIQKQKSLPIDSQVKLTEIELDEAVRQTLKNLALISNNDYASKELFTLNNIVAPINNRFSENVISNTFNLLTLNKQDSLAKAQNSPIINDDLKIDKNIFMKNRKVWISKLSNFILQDIDTYNKHIIDQKYMIDQELLENDQKDIKSMIVGIDKLNNKIKKNYDFESELLNTDYLKLSSFKEKLNQYYDNRDSIKIDQYKINSGIKSFNIRRLNREKQYISNLVKIDKDASIYKNQLLSQISISNISYYLDEISNYISNYSSTINHYKQDKISDISKVIAIQVAQKKNIKSKHLDKVKGDINQSSQKISQGEKIISQLQDKQKELTNLLIQLKSDNKTSLAINSTNDWKNFIDKNYNTAETPESRLQNIKVHYNDDIVIEKVPDLTEIPKETWIHENKEIWLSKKQLWDNRHKQILGDQYHFIKSKWFDPSPDLAFKEGSKAFYQKKYYEAIYLLNYISEDKKALIMLGQSYYYLGAYRDAFTVFITAVKMGIPESRYWLDLTAEKIIERKIQ